MDHEEARFLLNYYNNWRKGADIEMVSPAKITEAIDVAVKLLKAFEKPVSKCDPPLRDTNTYIENGERKIPDVPIDKTQEL